MKPYWFLLHRHNILDALSGFGRAHTSSRFPLFQLENAERSGIGSLFRFAQRPPAESRAFTGVPTGTSPQGPFRSECLGRPSFRHSLFSLPLQPCAGDPTEGLAHFRHIPLATPHPHLVLFVCLFVSAKGRTSADRIHILYTLGK